KAAEGEAANKEAAEAQRNLGALAAVNDGPKALAAYTRATELDPRNLDGWMGLGNVKFLAGDLPAAEAAFRQVLTLADPVGDQRVLAVAYLTLGGLQMMRQELDGAEASTRQGRRISESLGDDGGMAMADRQLGQLSMLRGDLDRATTLFRDTLLIFEAQSN